MRIIRLTMVSYLRIVPLIIQFLQFLSVFVKNIHITHILRLEHLTDKYRKRMKR